MMKILKKSRNAIKLINNLFHKKKQELREGLTSLKLTLTTKDEFGNSLSKQLKKVGGDITIQGVMICIAMIPFAVFFHNWHLANPLLIPSYGVIPWIILNWMRLVHEKKFNK